MNHKLGRGERTAILMLWNYLALKKSLLYRQPHIPPKIIKRRSTCFRGENAMQRQPLALQSVELYAWQNCEAGCEGITIAQKLEYLLSRERWHPNYNDNAY